MRRTFGLILVILGIAGPLAGQRLARQDLALLETDRGDTRTRRELELGKEALDRATTTGDWDSYQKAVRHFEEAALKSPALAEPWFGLALSRLALFESGANALFSPTQPFGVPNRAAWASHIRATLARDPGHRGALTSLGHVLLPQGERDQPAWLRTALVRAESLGVATPDLILIRGRLARLEHRYDEAVVAFSAYAAAGGDPAIAALERARALAGAGDLDAAAESYAAGLSALTPEGLRQYREDLAWITEGDELTALEALGPAEAPRWIRRFWLRRDAGDVRMEGERLQEHLRRWVVATERYRVVAPDRRLLFHEPWAPITPCLPSDGFNLTQAGAREGRDSLDPRRAERLLDDRGLMYLRHGQPLNAVWSMGAGERDRGTEDAAFEAELQRAELPAGVAETERALRGRSQGRRLGSIDEGLNAAEVWTYFIEGELRSFLFTGSRWLGLDRPTTLTSYIGSPDLALLRAQVDPRFYRIWAQYQLESRRNVPFACLPSIQRLARKVRSDLMTGGQSDDHPLFFPVPAIPAVQVAAVGHPSEGNGQVVVAYAMPAHRVVPTRVDGRFAYPLRWRLTAVDSSGEVHRREGSLMPTGPDSLREGQYLSGTLTLPIPPGTWQVGVAIFQPDERRGGAVQARQVQLDAASVSLSDIILGRADDLVRWNGVPMNPLGTWRRGSTMAVYTELRGLSPGTEARATFEIRQLDRATGRPAARVTSSSTTTPGVTAIDRTIDLGRLSVGIYRLTLTIETEAGVRLVREKVFEVVE